MALEGWPKGLRVASDAGQIGWVPYLVLCGLGLTLGLTWIGPRASEGLGTLNTMAFWAAHVWPALALLAITQKTLSKIRLVASLNGLGQVVLSAVVASVLFTPVALGVDVAFGVVPSRDDEGDPLLLAAILEFGQFAVPIVLAWILINAPSLLRIENDPVIIQEQNPQPPEVVGTPMQPEFWTRVPKRLGRDLVALSAELHYLRVYTSLGETLILYPFGRAKDSLSRISGMQVHRSHWVALSHVTDVINKDGLTFCTMTGGLRIPVSRQYRAAVKSAWDSKV